MPWVKLRRWLDSFEKRRRREWKLQAMLHSLGAASLFGGGGDSSESGEPYSEAGASEWEINRLAVDDKAVQVRYVTPSG